MNECFGKKFILNGELETADLFDITLVYEGDSVYEVIRMIRGVPVFFNDHMERLETSLRLQKRDPIVSAGKIKKDIISLAKSEKKRDINLKIVFNYNNGKSNYLVYFIEPIYPAEEQYFNGVKGILFYAERKDPESKVIDHKLRSSIYHKLILEGAYEALLVNEKGEITEGSRSNIFFLKNGTLYTAPEDFILSGITRKHVLDICRENNIMVRFKAVRADKLSEYEAVFMTGTSPMVLPFNFVDDKRFKVRIQLVESLRRKYLERAEASIAEFRNGK